MRGSDLIRFAELPIALADAVMRADDALEPFEALLTAVMEVGDLLADRVPRAAQRRAVIRSSPDLQERERTKFAEVTDALTGALTSARQRPNSLPAYAAAISASSVISNQ